MHCLKKCSWIEALSEEMLLKWSTVWRNALEMKHCLKKCSWNERNALEMKHCPKKCSWIEALSKEMLLKWKKCLKTHRCEHFFGQCIGVWAQSCLGTIVSGHNRVWVQSCLGKIVWAQSCGLKYVWAQSCGLQSNLDLILHKGSRVV